MASYRDLDAFKACHQLTLAVHGVVRDVDDGDPDLASQLWTAALIAPSRLARGAGCRSRRLFAACVDRTLGALSEIGHHLDVAHELELIGDRERGEIETLRGRARFYVAKLAMSLEADPAGGRDSGP
jgi:four helix bundle protein